MRIATELTEGRLTAVIADGAAECRVTLTSLRELEEVHFLCTAADVAQRGVVPARLRIHFADHFAKSSQPDGSCEFCKLTGRILAAEGRKRLSEREDRARSIRVIAPGVTGAQLAAAESRAARRPQPRVGLAARTDNAWF